MGPLVQQHFGFDLDRDEEVQSLTVPSTVLCRGDNIAPYIRPVVTLVSLGSRRLPCRLNPTLMELSWPSVELVGHPLSVQRSILQAPCAQRSTDWRIPQFCIAGGHAETSGQPYDARESPCVNACLNAYLRLCSIGVQNSISPMCSCKSLESGTPTIL